MTSITSDSHLASVEQFFKECSLLRNQQAISRTEFDDLFNHFDQAWTTTRCGMASTTPRLNILKLLSFEFDESADSRFLAWLLDEAGEHEQGQFFLNAFLEFLRVPFRVIKQAPYQVRRECSFPSAGTRVDIIACSVSGPSPFAIFIENKIKAGEQPKQFDRTVDALVRFSNHHGIPKQNRVAVFLTVDGRAPWTYTIPSPSAVPKCSKKRLFEHFLQTFGHETTYSPLLEGLLRSYLLNLKIFTP